jgi:hypothetical protein
MRVSIATELGAGIFNGSSKDSIRLIHKGVDNDRR